MFSCDLNLQQFPTETLAAPCVHGATCRARTSVCPASLYKYSAYPPDFSEGHHSMPGQLTCRVPIIVIGTFYLSEEKARGPAERTPDGWPCFRGGEEGRRGRTGGAAPAWQRDTLWWETASCEEQHNPTNWVFIGGF